MGRSRRVAGILVLSALMATTAWVVGFVTALEIVPPAVPVPMDADPPENFGVFDEVWHHVREEFYGDAPPPEAVTFGAIRGTLDVLGDPYAEFLSGAETRTIVESVPAHMASGIGAWLERVPAGALVVATVPNSPARRADITPGDVIIGIDDEPLEGLTRDELSALLDGPVGTSVTVTLLDRDASEEGPPTRIVELVRADLQVPVVEVRTLDDNIAYVRIAHFGGDVVAQVDAALVDLRSHEVDTLLVDLRDNPGGQLSKLREVASRFVTGPLWVEQTGDGVERVVSSSRAQTPHFEHIVVLVNEGTASAAEILAAVLREARAAPLVGATTFGKSEVQGLHQLSDGSLLRLTVAQWRSPGGTSVVESGLRPDRVGDTPAEQLRAAIAAARAGDTAHVPGDPAAMP